MEFSFERTNYGTYETIEIDGITYIRYRGSAEFHPATQEELKMITRDKAKK